MRKALSLILVFAVAVQAAVAGLRVVRSNGITLTGADGIEFVGLSGITLTGADGILGYRSNGITLTGADGITLTGADGITLTGADGATYRGANGITLTGADGITLTGADGITLTGADGITLTGADGTTYTADSIFLRQPNGITLTGADGITLTGADGITLTGADGILRTGINGITLTGADGITLTGADGITLTGADGIILTGADSATGIGPGGVLFDLPQPSGITLTGADGITLTGADGITLTGADGITLTGADGITLTGADESTGLQGIDPELALTINSATDDSNINAVLVYHRPVTEADLNGLRSLGVHGGTRFRALPMIYVSATRGQLAAISRLPAIRSIWGNRTLELNSDPYFEKTGIERIPADADLRADNGGNAITGRNVTVAVLDTGINSTHPDLADKVVQNVRLADVQSVPSGFVFPAPIEGIANTDLINGHGTFVGGIIAGSGAASNGRFRGVAPGARLLGLSAGDMNLVHVLSGFDYVLENRDRYNVRVLNCSFSANTVFHLDDPVNIATKMLADRSVVTIFSAGNAGPGNGTMNPYASAPWVIGVGATDAVGRLAPFSSRGSFGDELQHPAIVAPGVDIAGPRTTSMSGILGLGGADLQRLTPSETPYYTTASGTSFSAPQVAGAVALMLEADPSLSPTAIKDILSRTATPLPNYFYHESGAGMLNTHAAVLEAAFPDRRLGSFRSTISRNAVRFTTSVHHQFEQTVIPGTAGTSAVSIPANTVEAVFKASWGFSANDLGLRLTAPNGANAGISNGANLFGLLGRRERVVLRRPASGRYQMHVFHTAGIGTPQNVYGLVEVTQIEYPELTDLAAMTPEMLAEVERSLAQSTVLPLGRSFRPTFAATRSELAESLVRAGLVPQYVAANAIYADVRDKASRCWVESVQAGPAGRMIFDADTHFRPNEPTRRLVAAVAFVKAAGLESQAATATLPLGLTDAATIPLAWRGHVAVALQNGFLMLDGTKFSAGKPLTRFELAKAVNTMLAQ